MAESLASLLDLSGELEVTIDSVPCTVFFRGDTIVLAFSEIKNVLGLRRMLPQAVRILRQLESRLNAAGLELVIEVQGHRVGRFRQGLSANWLARVLKVDPFRIESRELIAAFLRRQAPESS